MKKYILILVCIFTQVCVSRGQKNIPVDFAKLNKDNPFKTTKLTDTERDNILKGGQLTLTITNITGADSITILETKKPVTSGTCSFDITREAQNQIEAKKSSFDLNVKDDKSTLLGKVTFEWTLLKNEGDASKAADSRDAVLADFMGRNTFKNPYDAKGNKVHLFFDENGRLLNHLPVNIDQNDAFYCYILCQANDKDKYDIGVIEGDFNPSDLSIRPSAPLSIDVPKASGTSDNEAASAYTFATKIHEPVTSDHFKFQIIYKSEGKTKEGPIYSIRVNKLYHVGIGVSFINTQLANPDFKTVFNGTDTVIQAFNGGNRTLVTVNAIWYWSVLQQPRKGSVITSGRDILKDEPTFSLRRIFPTVGVSLDRDFNQNLFAGFVYEFARGGSIIGGMHYGRVKKLAYANYQLGKTPFHGTDNDIITDHEYKTAFFIGVNLDTRIVNALFSRQ